MTQPRSERGPECVGQGPFLTVPLDLTLTESDSLEVHRW